MNDFLDTNPTKKKTTREFHSPEVRLIVGREKSAQRFPDEGYHAVPPLVNLFLELVVLHPVIAPIQEVLLGHTARRKKRKKKKALGRLV